MVTTVFRPFFAIKANRFHPLAAEGASARMTSFGSIERFTGTPGSDPLKIEPTVVVPPSTTTFSFFGNGPDQSTKPSDGPW
jgi:hypothetical protein